VEKPSANFQLVDGNHQLAVANAALRSRPSGLSPANGTLERGNFQLVDRKMTLPPRNGDQSLANVEKQASNGPESTGPGALRMPNGVEPIGAGRIRLGFGVNQWRRHPGMYR
jgi:hypothetical protein